MERGKFPVKGLEGKRPYRGRREVICEVRAGRDGNYEKKGRASLVAQW